MVKLIKEQDERVSGAVRYIQKNYDGGQDYDLSEWFRNSTWKQVQDIVDIVLLRPGVSSVVIDLYDGRLFSLDKQGEIDFNSERSWHYR